MDLLFITGNTIKFEVARRIFITQGIEIKQNELELPEIQSNNNEDIAQYSATYAFKMLNKPLMVTDAGFFIPALNGFPGPYIKYINQTLGVEDFIRLMDGRTDRRIMIRETVCFIDKEERLVCFTEETECQLAQKSQGKGSIMDQLLILPGYEVPQSFLTMDQITDFFWSQLSHYEKLAQYLTDLKVE